MSIDLTNTPELPAPVPARSGAGVELRASREDVVLARVAIAAVGGFAFAVLVLLGLGIAVIS